MNWVRLRSFTALLSGCAGLMLTIPCTSRAVDGPLDASPASSQPLEDSQQTVQQIAAEYSAVSQRLAQFLPPGRLADPARRNAAAPHAIPLILQREQLIEELAATRRVQPVVILQRRRENQSTLYLLGDPATVGKVKEMIASGDPVRQNDGRAIILTADWIPAGTDKAQAEKVADDVEKLDRANPKDPRLTLMTMNLSQSAPAPALNRRLLLLLRDVMTDPLAARLRPQIAAQLRAQDSAIAAQKSMLDKPIVIAGKTIDGTGFTTASWKGKVVLVDFWATWCPPCRADIADLKNLYQQDHTGGLEIVGVSNDYNAKSLADFISKNNVPWSSLFDADAAANQKWNPLCDQNNVLILPCLFLIDRNGVLRGTGSADELAAMVPELLKQSSEIQH